MSEEAFNLAEEMETDAAVVEEQTPATLEEITKLAEQMRSLLGASIEAPPSGDSMSGITDWAKKYKLTEMPLPEALTTYTIAELVSALSRKVKEFRAISETKLPEAMKSVGTAGMKLFEMEDGTKIELKDELICGVRAGKFPDVKEWLKTINLADIIKESATFKFQWDDEAKMKELEDFAREKFGWETETKEAIHPATLKAQLTALRAKTDKEGKLLYPTEFLEPMFTMFDYRKAVIKLKKK